MEVFSHDGFMIRDVIYGILRFPEAFRALVGHPLFQRLGGLKQLGHTHLVYPSATHTRKEHSLGTAHLSMVWARHLVDCIPAGLLRGFLQAFFRGWLFVEDHHPWVEVSQVAINLVGIAGLFHDLGHGPLSHLYDQMTGTHHEARSAAVAADIMAAAGFGAASIAIVQALITGEMGDHALGQVVCNVATGIDADKLDYLCRDFTHLGMALGSDPTRLVHASAVAFLPGGAASTIAFRDKEVWNIRNLFNARFVLHRQVCRHHTVLAADLSLLRIVAETGIDIPAAATDAIYAAEAWSHRPEVAARLLAHQSRQGFPRITYREMEPGEPTPPAAAFLHNGVVEFNSILPEDVRRNLRLFDARGGAVPNDDALPATAPLSRCVYTAIWPQYKTRTTWSRSHGLGVATPAAPQGSRGRGRRVLHLPGAPDGGGDLRHPGVRPPPARRLRRPDLFSPQGRMPPLPPPGDRGRIPLGGLRQPDVLQRVHGAVPAGRHPAPH